MELNDYENAKIYFENAIKIDEVFYHKYHHEILNKKNNLAICLFNSSREEKKQAKNMIYTIIEECNNTEFKYSKVFASVIITLAQIYVEEENFDLAIKYFKQVKDIYIKLYGELNLNVSNINKYIADCLLKVDKKQALKIFEDILRDDKLIYENLKKEKLNMKNIEEVILEDLISLGKLLMDPDMGKYRDSIKFIKKALSIMSVRYKDNSDQITDCIKLLMVANFELTYYEKSYNYAQKALNNDIVNYSKDSERVALDYSSLAYILYIMGNKSKSKELIKKSMEIIKKNINVSDETRGIINQNFTIIMDSDKNNIFESISKYDFETIEHNDTLIIRPFLKI